MPADIPDASTATAADVPATSPVANELPVSEAQSPPWYRSYRWVICALLFFATTINYVDRAVFGVLGPTLQKEMGWTPTQFGDVNAAFTLAYAIGFLFVGWFIDRVGTRWGYTICLIVWSLAAAGHALARSTMGFMIARFALGIGEAGNFPAAIKTTAEWFPKKERATATGIFNAGSNVGAIIAPAVVPFIALTWGWRWAFIITGLAGLAWVFFWLPLYRKPRELVAGGDAPADANTPMATGGAGAGTLSYRSGREPQPRVRLSPQELAYIESDPPDPPVKVPWSRLIRFRQTWAFAIGKFMTDSIWWFYLFWFPVVMNDRFKVDLKSIGLPMITVYLLADVGSVGGGWLSSKLMSLGWSVNAARKTAMLVCAVCIVPVVMAPIVDNQWVAVWLVGVAAAAHQGFSANLFTLTSDMFPRKAVGSVVGIGGFFGAMGGFFLNMGAGRLREMFGSYVVVFAIAGSAYLVALLIIHLLVPRLEPANVLDEPQQRGFPVQ